MQKSNTFCINPFYQFMVKTDGTSGVCCNLDTPRNEEMLGNVNNTSIKDIWNSDFYKSLRLQLLNGEKPDVCTKCWKEEDQGLDSVRITSNREFDLVDESINLEKCAEDDGYLETNPGFLDLRLGNLCNLKCRSCSSDQSSQIQKENLKLEKKHGKMHFFNTNKNDNLFDWINDDSFWKELQDILPSVNLIYFVGGEPTLHERHYEILQKIIDDGRAKDVKLQYNTNLTNIQDRFISLTNQFREVELAVSIDGYGELNDYIRYPSEWKTIQHNLDRLTNEMSSLTLAIDLTLMSLNALRYLDVCDWLIDYNKKIGLLIMIFHICYEPKHMSLYVIPSKVRRKYLEESKERIANIKQSFIELDTKTDMGEMSFTKIFEEYITAMSSDIEYDGQERKNFIEYNNILDEHRGGKTLFEVLPEYEDIFNKKSSWSERKPRGLVTRYRNGSNTRTY
tara:strand:+ start:41 stop:1393 length:1353 start_codon:yes stop_codon:yes gene_type:complete